MVGLILGLIFGGFGGVGVGVVIARAVISEAANKEIAKYKER